jgi:hypothetical protein
VANRVRVKSLTIKMNKTDVVEGSFGAERFTLDEDGTALVSAETAADMVGSQPTHWAYAKDVEDLPKKVQAAQPPAQEKAQQAQAAEEAKLSKGGSK